MLSLISSLLYYLFHRHYFLEISIGPSTIASTIISAMKLRDVSFLVLFRIQSSLFFVVVVFFLCCYSCFVFCFCTRALSVFLIMKFLLQNAQFHSRCCLIGIWYIQLLRSFNVSSLANAKTPNVSISEFLDWLLHMDNLVVCSTSRFPSNDYL